MHSQLNNPWSTFLHTHHTVSENNLPLAELSESVEVSLDALQHAHGDPRKNKYYKRAELQLKALSRRLTGLRDEVGFELRPPVEAVLTKVSDVHDEVIAAIMSRKK